MTEFGAEEAQLRWWWALMARWIALGLRWKSDNSLGCSIMILYCHSKSLPRCLPGRVFPRVSVLWEIVFLLRSLFFFMAIFILPTNVATMLLIEDLAMFTNFCNWLCASAAGCTTTKPWPCTCCATHGFISITTASNVCSASVHKPRAFQRMHLTHWHITLRFRRCSVSLMVYHKLCGH